MSIGPNCLKYFEILDLTGVNDDYFAMYTYMGKSIKLGLTMMVVRVNNDINIGVM